MSQKIALRGSLGCGDFVKLGLAWSCEAEMCSWNRRQIKEIHYVCKQMAKPSTSKCWIGKPVRQYHIGHNLHVIWQLVLTKKKNDENNISRILDEAKKSTPMETFIKTATASYGCSLFDCACLFDRDLLLDKIK